MKITFIKLLKTGKHSMKNAKYSENYNGEDYNKKNSKKKDENRINDFVNYKLLNCESSEEENALCKKNEKRKKDKTKKENKGNIKFIKKNQIALLTISLMIITAGYMNYTNNLKINVAELGDAQLVSTNVITDLQNQSTSENEANDNSNIKDENKINENELNNDIEDDNEEKRDETIQKDKSNQNENRIENASNNVSIEAGTMTNSDEYFAQTRLERTTMYSQMLETYQKILENEKISNDQKSIAANEIKNINDRKNAISIIENLIKTKGFKDVAVLINDNSINVVVKQTNNLNEEQVAQIENIVSRELKAEIEDIHITTHK